MPLTTAFSRSASSRMMFGDLPPELERDLLDGGRGELADAPAGARGPGEGDHVDPGVGGDRLADHGAVAA